MVGNMTSTPHNLQDTRSAISEARKAAEAEAERLEILRRFPTSVSQYMVKTEDAPANCEKLISVKDPGETGGKRSSVDALWKELEDLQTTRKYLDENLAAIERGRGGENIAAKVDYEILLQHPEADPEAVEKLRIRKMVDEQIKSIQGKIKAEAAREETLIGHIGVKGFAKSAAGGSGKLPKARAGARVDTGLRRQLPYTRSATHNQKSGKNMKILPKKGTRSLSADPKGLRKRSPSPSQNKSFLDGTILADDEEYVTHVYGRADYHPRRSTVHNPYIHLNTPMRQPNFRKKQAVEVVKANLIRSAKTQTSPATASKAKQSQYYFTPSTSPVRPPISMSPTPGKLIPMAIPLGAPKISDASDPSHLLIHQGDPQFVTLTTGSPRKSQKTIRIYDPSSQGLHGKKPNTAVITVQGEDGPNLAVQKLNNIDIDTPEVSQATVPKIYSPSRDDGHLPGTSLVGRHERDESEATDGSLHIELRGQAASEAKLDYHGPVFPPAAPPDNLLSASDIADEIDKHEIENEAIRWVEQEIMARILTELHPPGSPNRIRDTGPVQDGDSEKGVEEQESVLLNPESLQLFIDAGLPIDTETINRLVKEELSAILHDMIKQTAQERVVKPTIPITTAEPTHVQHTPSYKVSTPLPTPEPSPASSLSERPKPHLHTPSITPESSIAESLPPEPSPSPTSKSLSHTPEVLSAPKTPEEITLVQTPEATPPVTPTPVPEDPGTPTFSESSKSILPPATPPKKFPDPWGGAEFPLPEELDIKAKRPSAMTFAPPPNALDLVVRELTPPPVSPTDRSDLSDSETPTTSSSDRGESSISEGQLVISHGEMRLKTKVGRLPGIIEELFNDEDVEHSMAFQSTLRDANELQNEDYEPYSDGEIRLGMRPSMIAKVSGHGKQSRPKPHDPAPGDDPAGIYSRPRHPIPSEDEGEDLSVGEVKPKTIMDRKSRFKRWREERSPKYTKSQEVTTKTAKPSKKRDVSEAEHLPDSPLSVGDLRRHEQSPQASEAESYLTKRSDNASNVESASLGANVIVVAPTSSEKTPQPSRESKQDISKKPSETGMFQVPPATMTSADMENTGASTDQSALIKDSLDESMRKKDSLLVKGTFFEDEGKPAQGQLKVSLTLPSAEHMVSVSSEPVTDDVSEISTAGF